MSEINNISNNKSTANWVDNVLNNTTVSIFFSKHFLENNN